MSPHLQVAIEGRLGVIALDRPEAINALSLEMIRGITAELAAWRDDPLIKAVLFEGRGPKGFCAGGDVRYVRTQVLEGRPAAADAYFAAEYAMNALIATFPKPVVVLAGGVVMGGGIGIAGHAAFRITTAEARYAMPEAAIGFAADVGVNWILGRTPEHRALLFLMTGVPVSGADVLALGLADCCVAPSRIEPIRAGIVSAAGAANIEPALVALMQSESIQAGERNLVGLADRHWQAFEEDTAGGIADALAEAAAGDADLVPLVTVLRGRSPTSLEAILNSHRAARGLSDIHAVLALDRRVASFLVRQPDFAEGVRAQLVDKDQKPLWNPATLATVDRAGLMAAIGTDRHPSSIAQG